MSNSSGKKLKSVLQSRRLIVPLVAILVLTSLQIGSRPVSASDDGVTLVVTPDITTASLLPGNLQVVDAGPDDQVDAHLDCNLVVYTNVDIGLPKVKYFNLSTNTGAFVPTTEVWDETFLSDVSGTRIAFTMQLDRARHLRATHQSD
jgi:hypothetical protein